jgi:hypothetical protein
MSTNRSRSAARTTASDTGSRTAAGLMMNGNQERARQTRALERMAARNHGRPVDEATWAW